MLNCLLVASSRVLWGFDYFVRIPNLGLSSIAGNLDKSICNVQILDLVARQKSPVKFFTRYIKKNKFDFIGFSCMVFQYHEMLHLAKIAKSLNKDVITVVGGYYSTVNYREIPTDDLNYIDFFIRGEGEIAFNELIKCIHDKKDYSKVPNLSYNHEGQLVHNECGPLIDLEKLALPDRKCRVFRKAFYMTGRQGDVVETSRGCTFTCNFCSITKMYGKSYRQFGMSRIIQDIKNAVNNGARAIFFTDDNITLNHNHFENLCNAIIDAKLTHIKYAVQASIKGFYDHPELIKLMKKAGFDTVFLGIESIADDTLEFFNKDNQFNSNSIGTVVKRLKEENIFVIGGFIIGNPSDNHDSLSRMYQFIADLKFDMIIPFALTPYPGTKLREELISENLVTNLFDYAKYDTYQMNIRTKYLSQQELFAIHDDMTHRFYIESGIMWRFFKKHTFFLIKTSINFLFSHPDFVFHHLTKGIFLNKNRYKDKVEVYR